MSELPPDLFAAGGGVGAVLQGVNVRAQSGEPTAQKSPFAEILGFQTAPVAERLQTSHGNTSQALQTLSALRETLADLLESLESLESLQGEISVGNAEGQQGVVAETRAMIAQLTELMPAGVTDALPTRLGNNENLSELQTISALREALADLLESLESLQGEISVGNAEGQQGVVAEARAMIAQLTELLPSGASGTPASGLSSDGKAQELQRLTALREALARETTESLRGSGLASEKGPDTVRVSLQDSSSDASALLSEAGMKRVNFLSQGKFEGAALATSVSSRSGETAAAPTSLLPAVGTESRILTDSSISLLAPDNTQSPQTGRLLAPEFTTPPMPAARTAAVQTLDRVVMMRRAGVDQARIQLHPPELGRVDIRLEMDGSDTRVQFVVQNAGVKDSMEALLPKLKDALQQQGFDLSDASFAQANSQDSEDNGSEDDQEGWLAAAGTEGSGAPEDSAAPEIHAELARNRLLDMYV